MQHASAKTQTIRLTAVNALVRALGLGMRVWLSRTLGAEIMGIAELCSGIHLFAITPLTSGLPIAVSRLTSKAAPEARSLPLLAGISIVRILSALLIPLLLLCSPLIATLVGDTRVLPSLWMTAPCILILGYSAVYNGYCYGVERSGLPAASELIEQCVRIVLCVALICGLSRLASAWLAAVPVFATMLAEICGLIFVLGKLRLPTQTDRSLSAARNSVVRLAVPTTVTRLVNTGLRSVTAILIPLRLQASGLPAVESTSRLGMLNGMVMPIVMLPCIFTSALAMVSLPKLAQAEHDRQALGRLLRVMLISALAVALVCSALVWFAAPFLANGVYRLAELKPLFQASAPLVLLSALSHITNGILGGLGKQKQAMYAAIGSSVLSLALVFWLTETLRLEGTIVALSVGQAIVLLWNILSLARILRALPYSLGN